MTQFKIDVNIFIKIKGGFMKSVATIIVVYISLIMFSTIAQTVSIFDTVYTPVGNPDGQWVGTMFVPSSGNGIGVLVVHGSGVSRITNRVWCDTLVAHGYTVFTIEYPLPPSYVYPKPPRAVKLAVEFLRRNALSFGITTGEIFGLGFSRGSATLGEAIIWDNDDTFFQTDPTINDHFDAVTLLYGYYEYEHYNNIPPAIYWQYFSNDTSLYQKGVCLKHVENISTPVLLLHGTGDNNVPYLQSVFLNDSLIAHGKMTEIILFSGLQHGFDINWPTANAFTVAGLVAKDSVLSFFNRIVTGIQQTDEISPPDGFVLSQNYPNPFNPSTTIRFQVPNSSFVNLKVYDILGNEVATLVNEEKQARGYEVNFNASKLSSGIYFYRIKAGSFVETKKMILLR